MKRHAAFLAMLALLLQPIANARAQSPPGTTPWQAYIDATLPQIAPTDPAARTVIQHAIDMMPGQGYRQYAVPTLRIPWGSPQRGGLPEEGGIYAIGVGLVIANPVRLDLAGTALLVAPNAKGITIQRLAQGTVIENGTIGSMSPDQTHTGVGIELRAPSCTLRNLVVREQGTAIFANGIVGDGYSVNGTQVHQVALFLPWHVGLHIQGGDSNGGIFSGVFSIGGEIGLLDLSFLGNLHVGSSFEAYTYRAIVSSQSARSTFAGIYIESEPNVPHPIDSGPYSTWVGGGAIPHVPVGPDRVGMGYSRLLFRDDLPGGDEVVVGIPSGGYYAAIGMSRTRAGVVLEQHALRWQDHPALLRFGLHSAGGNVPPNGLTMPWGTTSSFHPDGVGHAIANATQEDPYGHPIPEPDP